ncbi:hypothetical protein MNV84_03776 [Leishmania braziliensis]|nr:hypothetical protein MNV84_03776 [Leishmania braziliensis]
MPAMTTPSLPRYRHRESARSVVQRLHAIPVQLLPPHVFPLQYFACGGGGDADKDAPSVSPAAPFDAAAAASDGATSDGCTELGANSVCLVIAAPAAATVVSPMRASATGDAALFSAVASPAAEQRLAYEVAAAHALRGGRVLLIISPTSQAFSLARFSVTVERQWVALQQRRPETRSARRTDPTTVDQAEDVRGVGCIGRPTSSSALPLQSLSSTVQLRARQRAVLDAVQRVEVLPCTSMDDLYAVCQAYTFPIVSVGGATTAASAPEEAPGSPPSVVSGVTSLHSSWRLGVTSEPKVRPKSALSSSPSLADSGAVTAIASAAVPASPLAAFGAAASSSISVGSSTPHQVDIVPLCIVDGFVGSMSTSAALERASGQVIPVPHYVLCLLQRRLKCALMVVERGASVPTDGCTSGHTCRAFSSSSESLSSVKFLFGGHLQSQSDSCAALPSPARVLAASDLVQRLRAPHVHPSPVVSVSHTASSLMQTSAERFSEASGGVERQPGRKAARSDGAAEQSARTWFSQAPPVSLHDVQLSVAYIEWDAVWHPLQHGERQVGAHGACTSATSLQGGLLLPLSVAWRYRVHFMKAAVDEAASARVDGTDNLLHKRQSSGRESLWPPSRGSRRPSGALSFSTSTPSRLQYTGAWVRSTQWRHL